MASIACRRVLTVTHTLDIDACRKFFHYVDPFISTKTFPMQGGRFRTAMELIHVGQIEVNTPKALGLFDKYSLQRPTLADLIAFVHCSDLLVRNFLWDYGLVAFTKVWHASDCNGYIPTCTVEESSGRLQLSLAPIESFWSDCLLLGVRSRKAV
jgi:hypothetical protein